MRKRPVSPVDRAAIQQARNHASFRALVAHERLGTDLSRRVEVFDIIEKERIWLMFKPLKSIYGAYQREDGVAGIMIHAGHPLGLQRFTGAHEFGHHELGHTSSVDDAEKIEAGSQESDPQEAAAQTFANEFLMPLELVNAVFQRMKLPLAVSSLTARQVYEFSLRVGVSYAAAVSRLVGLRRLTVEHARTLRPVSPLQIKRDLGGGVGPAESRADVWLLEQSDAGRRLTVKPHDELHLVLPENPSTGYLWTLESEGVADIRGDDFAAKDSSKVLGLVHSGPSTPTPERNLFSEDSPVGVGGERRLVFRALRPGVLRLQLAQRRPWQRGGEAQTFEVSGQVATRRTGDAEQGLSESQKASFKLSENEG